MATPNSPEPPVACDSPPNIALAPGCTLVTGCFPSPYPMGRGWPQPQSPLHSVIPHTIFDVKTDFFWQALSAGTIKLVRRPQG